MQAFILNAYKNNAQSVIRGRIGKKDTTLRLQVVVQSSHSLHWSDLHDSPQRRHELWKSTCLEVFVAVEQRAEYWEYNLAPNGDYQIYAFSDYRQGLREEDLQNKITIHSSKHTGQYQLNVDLPLFTPGLPLRIGIAAIIHYENEDKQHFALAHTNPQRPDFHQRESFQIRIES